MIRSGRAERGSSWSAGAMENSARSIRELCKPILSMRARSVHYRAVASIQAQQLLDLGLLDSDALKAQDAASPIPCGGAVAIVLEAREGPCRVAVKGFRFDIAPYSPDDEVLDPAVLGPEARILA